MGTTLRSFIDIFETAFMDGEEPVQLKKIAIPQELFMTGPQIK